ncbi:hypothetical protein NDU88_001197 [Pleurodeles waltl]|uniref:Uncharacterized protein n=1 Tax=Pleurodeles waltl TaxID=8319 RepID=A0AAV7KS49_PLEWA|nr:hypothetical protein NDU88_001197 [Pleurodeles waltl]
MVEVIEHYFTENWGRASTRAVEWDAMKVVLRGEFLKVTYGVKPQHSRSLDVLEKRLGDLEKGKPEQHQRLSKWKECKRELLETLDSLDKFVRTSYMHRLHMEGVKASRLLATLLQK